MDNYMADSVPHSSKKRLLYPAKKTVMGHWLLKLLLPLQKPLKEDSPHSPHFSEGNKNKTCLWGVSDSDGLSCIPIAHQAWSLGALSPSLLNQPLKWTLLSPCLIQEDIGCQKREMTAPSQTTNNWSLSLLVAGHVLLPEVGDRCTSNV